MAMRRFCSFLIIVALIFCLSACAKSAEVQWQEQYDLGVRYLAEGNYEEAIIAFTAAIEIDPNRAEAYVGRGDAYVASEENTENLNAALSDYEVALGLDEALVDAYLGIANIYIIFEEYDLARSILEQGLATTESDMRIEEKIALLPEPQPELSLIEKKIVEVAYSNLEKGLYDELVFEVRNLLLNEELTDEDLEDKLLDYIFDGNNFSENFTGIGLQVLKDNIWSHLSFYFGNFAEGKREGNGVAIHFGFSHSYVHDLPHYNLFEGYWSNGLPNGEGVYTTVGSGSTRINGLLVPHRNFYSWTGNFTNGLFDGTIVGTRREDDTIYSQGTVDYKNGVPVFNERCIYNSYLDKYYIRDEINPDKWWSGWDDCANTVSAYPFEESILLKDT